MNNSKDESWIKSWIERYDDFKHRKGDATDSPMVRRLP